jgi:FdhD protein
VASLTDIASRHSARQVDIQRVGATRDDATDHVATEEPLEIRLGYDDDDGRRAERSISITMRTPGNDDELARGFLFTEGIIERPDQIELVRPCGPPADNGLINVIRVELAAGVAVELDRLERHFYTSSSCGVCGKASLDAIAVHGRFDVAAARFDVASTALSQLPTKLEPVQSVFERTGGLHASGLFDGEGRLIAAREDVGRHNALDKLIGYCLAGGHVPLLEHGIIVSGRASFELLQKAMVAGCPLIAAVGAPSSLAVDLAVEFGITLVGFLKSDRFNVYSRPDRII